MDLFKNVNAGVPYKILEQAGALDHPNSLVLFGGSPLDIILKRESCIKDFDLRLVGQEFMNDEEKCVQKAREFVSTIFSFLVKENERIAEAKEAVKRGRDVVSRSREVEYDISAVTVSRRASTVTVHIPRRQGSQATAAMMFQLTFAPSKSIQDMLAACQPHCTRVAIKDAKIVLDQTARYCIESTAIVADHTAFRSYYIDSNDEDEEEEENDRKAHGGRTVATQIVRYMKYFQEKGFDIILPRLDISKVPTRNLEYCVPEVLALPNLIVVLNKIVGNKIMTQSLALPQNVALKSRDQPMGGYDAKPEVSVGEAIHYNIRSLVHDVYDSFQFVVEGEVWNHVFDYVPSLQPRQVDKSYETVTASLTEGSIPLDRITGYFSETPPHEVVDQLIAKPLLAGARQTGKMPKTFKLDEDLLKQLIDKEIAALLVKIDGLREKLQSQGLDRLVIPYPENVSSDEELFEAFYGSYGVK